MGSSKKYYVLPPFIEGIASSFDLFGTIGISTKSIKRLNEERIKRNTILFDVSTAAADMKRAINQYAREIEKNR
jgi:hypothetical protein